MSRELCANRECAPPFGQKEDCDLYRNGYCTAPSEKEVEEKLNALDGPQNCVYLTGDTHGQFERILNFCTEMGAEEGSTFIILGDVGLNFFGNERDVEAKKLLASAAPTFFCIHGNHEMRPSEKLGYELQEYHGGKVWVEPAYPNIVFAIDGEVYDFCGYSCLVIGGAYSVDKQYRLALGFGWWPDEQPSDEIKRKVEQVLETRNWKVDIVLSHTCPLRYEPIEVFLSSIDQSTVDKSTEEWLDEIEGKLDYLYWYCGHYHTEKRIDKLRFVFNDYTFLRPKSELEEG